MKIRVFFGFAVMMGLCACGNSDHPTFTTQVQSSPNINSVGAAQQLVNLSVPSHLVELSQLSTEYRQWAQIRVDVWNPSKLDLSKDSLLVFLSQGNVSSSIRSNSLVRYQVRETYRTLRVISNQESVIQVSIVVEASL